MTAIIAQSTEADDLVIYCVRDKQTGKLLCTQSIYGKPTIYLSEKHAKAAISHIGRSWFFAAPSGSKKAVLCRPSP